MTAGERQLSDLGGALDAMRAEPLHPLDYADQRCRAVYRVLTAARDVADASELLEALGLDPDTDTALPGVVYTR